jgi:hypothetical protein
MPGITTLLGKSKSPEEPESESVPLDGDTVDAIRNSWDEIHVVIKRVWRALDVDFSSRLRNFRSTYCSGVVKTNTTGPDGKTHDNSCIPIQSLPRLV